MSLESLRSRRCPTPTSPARRRRNAHREVKGGVPLTLVLALVSIFWIAPLALLVITAVRPLSDFVGNGPLSWPQEFTWSNFTDAWRIGNFASTYRNSVILALLKVPLGVLISAMLAYALGKLRIRFARIDHVHGLPRADHPDLHHHRAELRHDAQPRR